MRICRGREGVQFCGGVWYVLTWHVGTRRHVQIDMTAHTIKCIDKAGGLDEYVLNARPRDLLDFGQVGL